MYQNGLSVCHLENAVNNDDIGMLGLRASARLEGRT